MKRICTVLMLICVLLCGCEKERKAGFPYIAYYDDLRDTYRDRKIPIKKGYVLNQGHSYDEVDTDDGYSITLYFVKEGEG